MDNLKLRRDIVMKIVVETAIPEDVVNKIVEHQFKGVVKAIGTQSSVEMSGFGKFIFNHKKAYKTIIKYDLMIGALENILKDSTISPQKRGSSISKIKTTTKVKESLLNKLRLYENQLEASLRGLEK